MDNMRLVWPIVFLILLSCIAEAQFLRLDPADLGALLSSVAGWGAHTFCNLISGLSPRQRSICLSQPTAIATVGQGASMAQAECRFQFRHQRWNCSTPDTDQDPLFGQLQTAGTREAAFTYAIRTAGVAHSIAQACNQGNLTSCGTCEPVQHHKQYTPNGWEWGGCTDSIEYGLRFARKFMDAGETEQNELSLMNVHNNRLGRKSLKDGIRTDCKCHGVSGACTMKTCWDMLPNFRTVGDTLMKRYQKAKAVVPIKAGRARTPKYLKLRSAKRVRRKPRRVDMVFLEDSPNYCDYNLEAGSMGTVGRQCNKTAQDMSGCDLMCCGRGYNTIQQTVTWQCHCKFHWCCSVTCQECTKEVEMHICK